MLVFCTVACRRFSSLAWALSSICVSLHWDFSVGYVTGWFLKYFCRRMKLLAVLGSCGSLLYD